MKRRPNLSWEETDAIRKRLERGESLKAIAVDIDRFPANLYKLMKRRYGYEFDPRNWYRPQTFFAPELDTELAYFAGLIDGEGSIVPREDGRYSVKVGMTNEAVIRWLHGFGGNFSVTDRPPPRKRVYTWQIGAQLDVLALLRAITPYMIVKRELAEKAISDLEARPPRGFRPKKRPTLLPG